MVKERFMRPYTINVIGEALSTFSGPRPHEIEPLMQAATKKNTVNLLYEIAKAEIELLCQKGSEGIKEAWNVFNRIRDEEYTYSCPINGFQRDKASGVPFMGAHYIVGAFRDSASDAYPEEWGIFKQGDKGKKKVGEAHLRKYIRVFPHHITFWRPNLEGEQIKEVDGIHDQQPSEKVKGFARYEVIEPPFEFHFSISFFPKGQFQEAISNQELVLATLRQAVNHGLGGRRAAGHGMWRIISLDIEDGVAFNQDIEDFKRGVEDGKRKRNAA